MRWPNPGIAYENVETAQLGQGSTHEHARTCTCRDVRGHRHGMNSHASRILGNRFSIRSPGVVADRHVCSSTGEELHRCCANAT
jgi:hypothetical protein